MAPKKKTTARAKKLAPAKRTAKRTPPSKKARASAPKRRTLKKSTLAREKKKNPTRKPPQRKRTPLRSLVGPSENPHAHRLALDIARILQDKKADNVVVLDVRGRAQFADYLVVASADNTRSVLAFSEAIREQIKAQGLRPNSIEGEETGNWVLMDYGDVVAHIFETEHRFSYDIEGLWADAPRERLPAVGS